MLLFYADREIGPKATPCTIPVFNINTFVTNAYLHTLLKPNVTNVTVNTSVITMPRYHQADQIEPPTATESQTQAFLDKYPGWIPTITIRPREAWVWKFGFDFQSGNKRCWICKICTTSRTPQLKAVVDQGSQNAMGHLFKKHYITAPTNGKKSREEIKYSINANDYYRNLAAYMKLNQQNPYKNTVIYKLAGSFDKQHF